LALLLRGAFIIAPVEDDGEALADADAQDTRVARARLLQLARHREREARARGAERVADGDRAAVRVDARVLKSTFISFRQPSTWLAKPRDLDDVHVAQFEIALSRAWYRIGRPDAHDARLDAGARGREILTIGFLLF